MNRVKNDGKCRHLGKFKFQEWMMEKVLILCEKMFLIRCRVRCMLVAGVHLVCHLIVVGQVASSENRPSPKQARWKFFKSSGAHRGIKSPNLHHQTLQRIRNIFSYKIRTFSIIHSWNSKMPKCRHFSLFLILFIHFGLGQFYFYPGLFYAICM